MPSTVVIRTATALDQADLARLAALDTAPLPTGRVLLAEVDDEVQAAVEVATGHVVADPFRHTADVAELLRLRASRLTGAPAASHRGVRAHLLRRHRRGLPVT